jgi:hypothetical protein
MMSATDTNETISRRSALRDGSKVRITIAGQAPREVEPYEPFVQNPRSTSFDAWIKSEPEGPECPDLDTVRGIGRATFYVLKDMLTQFEALVKAIPTKTTPLYVCVTPDCAATAATAVYAAIEAAQNPSQPPVTQTPEGTTMIIDMLKGVDRRLDHINTRLAELESQCKE